MKAPAVSFLVLQAGAPCALVCITGMKRGTVLMPAAGAPIKLFANRRRARMAVKRTKRIAAQLRDSLLSDWPKLKPLFSGQPFTIQPTAKP